ncbi:RNA polymerase sigma factor [Clostridium aminobutyricum]|uniref:RNA polymerase sigma factor n=1 Tax=Clostridium aminobutyricum TaxID=33953 RepID=A0A939IJQ3_CLOAM|nr:RNA polymerase sigma factor [Clostridium aminobutyricum]MBN7773833.1 RNA polymerase sigma factor [Clostridium aminobutyricum]
MNKKQLFENYLTQHIDSAYRFAYTYAKNREDAEDIVNESIIKAIKSIHHLQMPEHIKPWFYKIIVNTALTYLKRKSKISYLDYENVTDTEGIEDDYSELTINSLIEKLDLKYKSIIVLRFLEDMSLSEISQILDINENTVKTRLYNALKLLKVDMEGDEYERF